MKKSVCVLLICCILLFSASAFADEMPAIANNAAEDDVFEYSEFRISMSANVQAMDNETYVLVSSLYDKGNMIDLDYCVGPVGTASACFDTTLTLGEDVSGCSVILVVLRKTAEGLILVNKASYSFSGENALSLIKDNYPEVSEASFPEAYEIISTEAMKIDGLKTNNILGDGTYISSTLSDGRKLNYDFQFFRIKKRKPLDVPHVETPVQKPLEGVLNIVYDGEYMYSLLPPRVEKNNVYIPTYSALNALGFKFSFEDGKLVGTKGAEIITLTRGSNKVIYNNKTYKLTKAVANDNTEMVSLTELAKIVGKECTYNLAENVCVIKDKEAAQ